jgi:hypothetical protein
MYSQAELVAKVLAHFVPINQYPLKLKRRGKWKIMEEEYPNS